MADRQVRVREGRNIPVLAITAAAGLAAVLALVNTVLAYRNTVLNGEVQERQQVINQGIQLSPLNEQLSKLIGNLAFQSGDIDLRAVLQRHGITVAPGAAPIPNQAPAPAQPGAAADVQPTGPTAAPKKQDQR